MHNQYDRRAALYVLVLCSLLNITLVNSCFITNCPSGGKKRSDSLGSPIRKCPPCGPLGMGQCFGPSLCCGPLIGCHLNTPDSRVCQAENQSPTLCVNDAPRCEAVDRGYCATHGFCCNDRGECKAEELCQTNNLSVQPRDPLQDWFGSRIEAHAFLPPRESASGSRHNKLASGYRGLLELGHLHSRNERALGRQFPVMTYPEEP